MSEKWSVTQWWLASLDQYGNAKLVDGPHASRSGVEKAFYIIQRLNLVKGPYACARVALSNVEPRSKGVNEGALDILTKGPHPMTAPGFSATKEGRMTETPAEIIAATLSTFYDREAQAREIIAALAAAGYKILPREPTEAMDQARYDLSSRQNGGSILEYYRAMWDATP